MNLLKKTWSEFSQDDCFRMAAALAYYAVFSLPPLLVVIISVGGLIARPFVQGGQGAIRGEVQTQIESVIGPGGGEQVNNMITAASDQKKGIWGTVIGLVVLLFGATGVLVQLQRALNEAWDVEPDPDKGGIKNFVMKRILSLGLLLAIGFLLMVSLVLSTVISGLQDQIQEWLPVAIPSQAVLAGDLFVSWIIFTLLFAAIFRYMPDADVGWRDVWIGGLLTGLLMVVGKYLLSLYFSTADVASTYGAAGSLALILLWVYYSSLILLFGAEFTQVWARRHGRQIQPSAGAMRVVERVQRGQAAAT
jgi:membrane protein